LKPHLPPPTLHPPLRTLLLLPPLPLRKPLPLLLTLLRPLLTLLRLPPSNSCFSGNFRKPPSGGFLLPASRVLQVSRPSCGAHGQRQAKKNPALAGFFHGADRSLIPGWC
jgi:hypothetical protein